MPATGSYLYGSYLIRRSWVFGGARDHVTFVHIFQHEQYGASDGVVFQGAKLYLVVLRSQAYQRDSCQIQAAVRCERRVVIVVERRARLSVGW